MSPHPAFVIESPAPSKPEPGPEPAPAAAPEADPSDRDRPRRGDDAPLRSRLAGHVGARARDGEGPAPEGSARSGQPDPPLVRPGGPGSAPRGPRLHGAREAGFP